MKYQRFSPALVAAALLVAPLAADAQSQPQAPAPAPVPDSVQQMMMEFQQLQQRLGQVQQQTLAGDSALQQRQAGLQATVEQAMTEVAPGIEQKIERLEALSGELQAAQGDQARIQALLSEGQALQQEVQAAQAQAVERDDVAAEIEAFRTALVAGMTVVEPKTPEMIARLEELGRRLEAALAS